MHQPDDEGPQQIIREVHHYRDGGERSHNFGRLVDTLVPMAIAALVGVVWMLSNSVTKLTEQVSSQAQIQNAQSLDLKTEVAELKTEVAELKADVKAASQ